MDSAYNIITIIYVLFQSLALLPPLKRFFNAQKQLHSNEHMQ